MLTAKSTLSEEIARTLRDNIVSGTIPAGERVNEVHLSKSLAVSRTPLREALFRLVNDGFVVASPNRGFFVTPLSYEDYEELVPVRAVLEPRALMLAGLPSAHRLESLYRLNRQLAEAGDSPRRLVELNARWHESLLADCPNEMLGGLCSQLRQRALRYELACVSGRTHVQPRLTGHEAVRGHLEREDLAGACEALERQLNEGAEPILRWLEDPDEAEAIDAYA